MPEFPSEPEATPGAAPPRARRRSVADVWAELNRRGLRDTITRYASHAALLLIIAVGAWAARSGLITLPETPFLTAGAEALDSRHPRRRSRHSTWRWVGAIPGR